MTKSSVPVTVYLDLELLRDLEIVAEHRDETVKRTIVRILRDHFFPARTLLSGWRLDRIAIDLDRKKQRP